MIFTSFSIDDNKIKTASVFGIIFVVYFDNSMATIRSVMESVTAHVNIFIL